MSEQITIDEKYTYEFDDGRVQILRHGEPWLGGPDQPGGFPGSKAWISAANEIQRLRERVAELEQNQQQHEPESEPEPTQPRYHSSDPEHLREDFTAAFKAALEPRLWAHVDLYGPARQITDHSDVQHQLRQVLNTYGAAVFGGIALFSLEAQTSIMGDAEALSHSRTLAEMGVTMRQLCWPADVLREEYLDQAANEDDPHERMRIRRIRQAVAEYTKKKEH